MSSNTPITIVYASYNTGDHSAFDESFRNLVKAKMSNPMSMMLIDKKSKSGKSILIAIDQSLIGFDKLDQLIIDLIAAVDYQTPKGNPAGYLKTGTHLFISGGVSYNTYFSNNYIPYNMRFPNKGSKYNMRRITNRRR